MEDFQGELALLEKPIVMTHIENLVKYYGSVKYPDMAAKYRGEIQILKAELECEIGKLARLQKKANDDQLAYYLNDEYQEILDNIATLSEYNAVLNRIIAPETDEEVKRTEFIARRIESAKRSFMA